MSLTSVWGALCTTALHAPRRLTSKLSELQWVHIGGEGEDVYEAHSELLILDGKLPWGSDALLHGGYVLFQLGDQIAKFKIRQIKKNKQKKNKKRHFGQITKFNNAHQIFLLYGMYHSLLIISPLPLPITVV